MKKGLITSILALTFTGLQAQPLPATPKLVVTLTIDQLRTDYMEAFSTLYGEKGFKRLMREGKVFYQTEFPFNGTDRASAIAAIYSGTTPSMNGISCPSTSTYCWLRNLTSACAMVIRTVVISPSVSPALAWRTRRRYPAASPASGR